MAITYVGAGAYNNGPTPVVSAYPAGAATDTIIALVGNKPYTSAPTNVNNTIVNTVTSGSVASAVDAGSVRATAFLRNSSPTAAGSDSFVVTSGSPVMTQGLRYANATGVWDVDGVGLADTVETGTTVSATGTAAAGQFTTGDAVIFHVVLKSDAITHTTQSVTIAGATLSAITWMTRSTSVSGNQGAQYIGRATITAGSSSASGAVTYTATSNTSGASATAVNVVRLRELPVTTVQDYKTEVLALDPALYLRLGETGTTTATNLGTLGGTATYSGSYTQGIATTLADGDTATQFTAAGQGIVSYPHNSALNLSTGPGQQWSISLRLRQDVWVSGTFPGLMRKGTTGTGGDGWGIFTTDAPVFKRNNVNSGSSAGSLTVGTWAHWVVTYDGANIRWYKNGVLDTTGAALSGAYTSTSTAALDLNVQSNVYGDHTIDEFVIIPGVVLHQAKINRLISAQTVAPVVSDPPKVGNVAGTFSFTGTADGTKTAAGIASGNYAFTGAAAGTVDKSGNSTGAFAFTSTPTGTAVKSGVSTGSFTFTGASTGSSPNGGTTTGSFAFTGTSTGTRISQGASQGSYAFSGVSAGTKTTQGNSSGSYGYTALPTGTTDKSGNASGAYSFVATDVTGTAPVVGANAGNASGSFTFTGSATGTTSKSGSSTGAVTFTSTATGSTVKSASATGSFTFSGASTGSRTAQGAVSGSVTFSAALTGSKATSGTANGSYAFTGAPSGSTDKSGNSSGNVTWTASVSGTAPVVGQSAGNVAGSFSFTGTVSGTTDKSGSATGSFSTSASITGNKPQGGSSEGTVTYTGEPTGFKVSSGDVTGEFNTTALVAGTTITSGNAEGTVVWTAEILTGGVSDVEIILTVYLDTVVLNTELNDSTLSLGLSDNYLNVGLV